MRPTVRPPNISSFPGHFPTTRYQEWNLQVQQEIGSKSRVVISYVGNHGIHEAYPNNTGNGYTMSDYNSDTGLFNQHVITGYPTCTPFGSPTPMGPLLASRSTVRYCDRVEPRRRFQQQLPHRFLPAPHDGWLCHQRQLHLGRTAWMKSPTVGSSPTLATPSWDKSIPRISAPATTATPTWIYGRVLTQRMCGPNRTASIAVG